MSNKRTRLKIFLPILILLIAFLGARFLIKQKQPPQKTKQIVRGALVQVITAKKNDITIPVRAIGTVTANREVDVSSELNGRVILVSENFAAGNFVNQGDLLFSLEKTDFELVLEKAKAEKEKINLELITLNNKAAVATNQWQQISPDKDPPPLTVYKPQLTSAKAQLNAALASIKQAELNLQRTQVHAPFSGLIQSKNIGLGQYVRTGSIAGHIIDSSQAEINIPLSPDTLKWLHIPQSGKNTTGSTATITMTAGDTNAVRHGSIVRSLGIIDPKTRMATVVIQIDDPYGLKSEQPFLLAKGAFVHVKFAGITLTNVIKIPRGALRNGNKVWTVNGENRLLSRPVTVERKLYNHVLISKGLLPGEKVIISALGAAADGMKLRPTEVEESP